MKDLLDAFFYHELGQFEVFSHSEARFIKASEAIGGEAGWSLGRVIVILKWQILGCVVVMAFCITGNEQVIGLDKNRDSLTKGKNI